jgi:hypothetical protein
MTMITTTKKSGFAKWLLFLCISGFATVAYAIHNQVDEIIKYIHYLFIGLIAISVAIAVVWALLIGKIIKPESRIAWGLLFAVISGALTYFLFTKKLIESVEDASGSIFNASIFLVIVTALFLRLR